MADIQYTPESRKLHADMMLRIAEKVILAIATSLIGVPFMLALAEKTTNTMQIYLLFLTFICLIPTFLVRNALSHYKELEKPPNTPSTPTQLNAPDSEGTPHIQIQHGNTHISISIQPEKNTVQ